MVLDGGILREKLGREIVVGDGGVMGRKVVTLKAERADPNLGGEVYDAEGIKD